MKPLQRAIVPQSEVELVIADLIRKWNDGNAEVRKCFPQATTQREAAEAIRKYCSEDVHRGEVWLNDLYQVEVRRQDHPAIVLSIKRVDREPIMDWRHLQEIKNQLIGPECEAVQLFPAESRLVDTSNQYWLWGIEDPTFRFPLGFSGQRVVSEHTVGKSKQRPFEKTNL